MDIDLELHWSEIHFSSQSLLRLSVIDFSPGRPLVPKRITYVNDLPRMFIGKELGWGLTLHDEQTHAE